MAPLIINRNCIFECEVNGRVRWYWAPFLSLVSLDYVITTVTNIALEILPSSSSVINIFMNFGLSYRSIRQVVTSMIELIRSAVYQLNPVLFVWRLKTYKYLVFLGSLSRPMQIEYAYLDTSIYPVIVKTYLHWRCLLQKVERLGPILIVQSSCPSERLASRQWPRRMVLIWLG